MEIQDAVGYIMKLANADADIQEAEAYASTNQVTMARVETL